MENNLSAKSLKLKSTEKNPILEIIDDENIINEITNIDEYINNIPEDELMYKIQQFKDIKEKKLNELKREENKLNEFEKNEKDNNSFIKNDNLSISSSNKNKNSFFKSQNENLSQFVESTILYREYEKNIDDLKQEYKLNLKKDLEILENNFQKERSKIIEEHRNKVKNLENEILKFKMELDTLENGKIIKREEYDKMVNKIISAYKQKYNSNENEIQKLEKEIEQEHSKLISNENSLNKLELNNEILSENNFSNEIDNLINELNQKKKQSGLIFIYSKLNIKENDKERPSQRSTNCIIKTDGSEQDYDFDTNENNENDEVSIRGIPSLNYEPLKKIQFFRTHQDKINN